MTSLNNLLNPEWITIYRTKDEKKWLVENTELPQNPPIELVFLINKYFAKSEFVEQVKRLRALKKQNAYMPSVASEKEEKNVEYRIDCILKNIEKLCTTT